ncbi:two-component system, OmpR family, heavy metal sensor histidine kinase CusS [Pseudomonas chlororaphis]|uniref:Sensor protein n=1 Tax=Pseudomonas chlororaphis subsp. aurantiaca TaxID=86192 RepID=A0AAJ0ZKU4_9PSED|nr:heavy metal sensor histidine kinase [Pseudomonas chlororaphis]AIS11262.1 histidine kinase [Pseudomonas chlororaphis subsp. aurantiaca]AZD69231.1 Heavy metal sensor histidine kinase [Pseudomonas chlororaphis subsp. aurantiaca]AZD75437.1 Heavy metal sensor histidine kinase [Pseudomonas chlororaphis subsp. aurantiaca]MBU4634334.1 heavy metal sensor histidine kinase [Pseudomonas chlororaphis subsp. aurantiaca]QIT25076.1 heavy metal sensor histidine kinase [Pseudomonas chlororaphis subsp. aurant
MPRNSIALRLSGLFTLVALLVFLLIGGALYQQVDKGLGLLPEAELDARYSVLESALTRFGNPEHWAKINNKLKLLSEEDKRIRFWVVSGDPAYEYGNPDPQIRRFAQGPLGMRDLTLPGHPYPLKVLVSQLPAKELRPPLRFLIAIDTETFYETQHQLLIALISLAIVGVLLASALGYWVARIGLKPLIGLSEEAQRLAPPRLSGRLQLSSLPPELTQFANSFNSTLERVEQAYSRLESFNADVAHELRSPLTNLIGQTQVALTRGRSAEHYFEVLQSNLEELERLRSIINDMLFLASADQGSKATKLTSTSLASEVATTLDYLDFILEDAQVKVEVRGDAQVQIEIAHLRRALINLLSNAVQHTEPGQVIQVQIDVQEHQVAIAVSNPGQAIAREHLPRLFERFYRVDASRSNSGANHGLGLAIVKAIALMHGGDVFVRSDDGMNTFGIYLPI